MAQSIASQSFDPSGDYASDADSLAVAINTHMSDVQAALEQGLSRTSNLGCLTWSFKVSVPSNYFDVTFLNAWTNFGSGWANSSYSKDSSGYVRLRGMLKSGTVGTTAFNIPVGFRPAATASFSVLSNGLFGRVDISSAGDVTPQPPCNNAYVSLDGIQFQCTDISPYVASCFPVKKQCTLPTGQAAWVTIDAVSDITPGLAAIQVSGFQCSWRNQSGYVSIDNIPGLIPSRTYLVTATAWPKG